MHRLGTVSVFGFTFGMSGVVLNYSLKLLGVTPDQKGMTQIEGDLIFVVMFGFSISLIMLILGRAGSFQYLSAGAEHSFVGVLSRAVFLGLGFSVGIILIKHNDAWRSPFGIYLCILTFFHYSEYFITSVTSPSTLSTDSFLLNHSKAYGIAAAASWLEYGIESYFFPGMKRFPFVVITGFLICLSGEVLRKLAMLTAMENFTHVIREEKVEGHKLVTHGVFQLCRHPSYAGWFWWSVGTQILLANPVCAIGYAMASWNFFCYRITYEEATLYSFFGQEYMRYQERVPRTGVPLVTGYKNQK